MLCCALVARAADAPKPALREVWRLAASSQTAEAQSVLAKIPAENPRGAALASVVLELSRPPVAESRLPALETTLAELARGDDDLAALALYLQARIHQVHLPRPDLARAAELYRELARRQPASHWAQLGLVKLGLMTLYATPEPADPAARIAAAAALLDRIAEPPLQRDLHLQIGWAALHYQRPLGEGLPHLIAADRIGGLLGITPEDLVVQIGELSFRHGDLMQARHYLERFLQEFPTNTRRFNVRQRLAEVNAQIAATTRPEEGGS